MYGYIDIHFFSPAMLPIPLSYSSAFLSILNGPKRQHLLTESGLQIVRAAQEVGKTDTI